MKADLKFLDFYLKKWNLSAESLLADTPMSSVYFVERDGKVYVLKILNERGMKYEGQSAAALRYFAGNGAANLVESDDRALLMEYIPGQDLKTFRSHHGDDKACEVASIVLVKLHAGRGEVPRTLPSLSENFSALLAREGDPAFSNLVRVARGLLATESDKRVLHGDLHHLNLLQRESGDWVVIDPQPLFGERTYDVTNLLFNPDDDPGQVENKVTIQKRVSLFSSMLGISHARILKFAYAFGGLSASWALEDGKSPDRRLRIVKLLDELITSL